ncbi:phosphoribosylformylglycinamidine synthase, purS [Desulfurobacterium thermolithotrophum DSM 11699]|uniref:Phosphoribosylformylglycinamidine synthase subunit PurS n=1 Tax=Desulfurobacterium thermolithotrophum (strain DSM 11699 / BSA) TaxID=868864 RepID=F0S3E9_DESTD|nr:phosphoribosylformylglycinamidine synthase subunit PurS [Desulfurobacterium thermolithotrophum]ADY73371.1 phosphoribosylformylglycinamidine synthase, purS [Desulfurobacterium thermolithotrophum DSM 11699]
MANYFVKIFITYRKGVLDPQGIAVEKAAHSLGFEKVKNVKVGKYITMNIEADSPEEVKREIEEMAKKFLVNPVIEEYTYEVEEVKR